MRFLVGLDGIARRKAPAGLILTGRTPRTRQLTCLLLPSMLLYMYIYISFSSTTWDAVTMGYSVEARKRFVWGHSENLFGDQKTFCTNSKKRVTGLLHITAFKPLLGTFSLPRPWTNFLLFQTLKRFIKMNQSSVIFLINENDYHYHLKVRTHIKKRIRKIFQDFLLFSLNQ